jgi:2',3'-cyclic-nucleotide 2'-phosphodiesterase (5'-nucleotidase family)
MSARLCLVTCVLLACASSTTKAVPLTIIGTNDLHGRVERVAALSGHLSIVRQQLEKQHGGVVLVDGGDMFQGTLESNLEEGAAVVAAYNHVGYNAVCVGNHEFDFGPVGPLVTAKTPTDDPRGALKARAAQARFPFLAGNVIDDATHLPVDWPNVKPRTLITVGKGKHAIKVGIIGLSTVDTPKTTIASNVRGLTFAPLVDSVVAQATALRAAGARVVVVAAHAGGKCPDLHDATSLDSCDADAEVMKLARGIPVGVVDVIVAGHTHQTMAHVVNGIPIVESWANGRGFGRVDFDVDVASGKIALVKVHQPRRLCGDSADNDDVAIEKCAPSLYEGKQPQLDQKLLKQLQPYLKEAKVRRAEALGVVVNSEIKRGYDRESALGNLFADLLLKSTPGADVALMNGGGIRANLPAGALNYGAVFEMMPFDNRLATAQVTVLELRTLLEKNLGAAKKGGIFSTAGVLATITCGADGKATVVLRRTSGTLLRDNERLTIVTTDFVALGGDGGLGIDEARVVVDEGDPVRERLVEQLKKAGGSLAGDDAALFDLAHPRLHRAGHATARCGGE